MTLDVENYLNRISFNDVVKGDHPTLASLHRKHIKNVPFENLDIQLGREIILDVNKLEEKIVFANRGGFCYELNGLFFALLHQLGFNVKMISARVFGDEKFGREFDHMALIVKITDEWLVDVGFGNSFIEPIRLSLGKEQQDAAGFFQIVKHDSTYFRMQSSSDGLRYSPKYIFTLEGRNLDDFVGMCKYHQTSRQSSFTRERLCTMATSYGRVTLRGENLIETFNGHKTVKNVGDIHEFEQILRDKFQIII
jgi:N-hydroxyarylamine O-acetyltransferase